MKSFCVVAIFSIFLVALCSCGNSVQDMVDQYNEGFVQVTTTYTQESEVDDTVYQPGDDKFNPSDMLYAIYNISQNSTLNLAAPGNCSWYEWVMTDPDDTTNTELNIKLMDGYSRSTKKYVLYVPQSGLYASKTFKLRLTVLGNDGNLYSDTCGIAVYKDYYFSYASSRSAVETGSLTSNSGSSARMILPDSWSLSDSSLKYYLCARNAVTDETLAPIELEIEDDSLGASGKTGSVYLDLPKSDYYLSLYCTKGEPSDISSEEIIKASAVLSGYANADIRYNQSVVFYMASENLDGAGFAALKIFTDGWSLSDADYDGYAVSAEITETDGSEKSCNYYVELDNSNIAANSAPSNYNFRIGIESGTYLLNIRFSNGETTYSWYDSIVILAGKTTEATIGVPPIIEGGG